MNSCHVVPAVCTNPTNTNLRNVRNVKIVQMVSDTSLKINPEYFVSTF